MPQDKSGKSLTTSQETPLSPNLENAPLDPDLARLLEAWGKLDPKLKHMIKMLATLEADRPGA
jgi:hypothetical protein